ncbi:thioredoxin domain-containing protein [Candidatus Saccharibacteria bacterium]|nr:thioredoxin domain-containing protein [Candidatus Saccharibacteria bacterium]
MSKTAWIIFSLLTAGILGLMIVISGADKIDVSAIDINTIQVGTKQNGNIADHTEGSLNSKIILIEYGDYQCPGCGTENPKTQAIVSKYSDKIKFVFRNFPLYIHTNAKAAAATAEAAGLQGKFWQMHDKLYALQSEWSELSADSRDKKLLSYAENIGLDIAKYKTDIASKEINSKINFDYSLGQKAAVDSTPSFFLNGKKLDYSTWSDDTKFTAAIEEALKQ